MGTDRIVEAEGPCLCGSGNIVVYDCSGDQPFAKGHWWEGRINCAICSITYALECSDPDEKPALVSQADVDKRRKLRDSWHQQREAIATCPPVKALIQSAADLLNRGIIPLTHPAPPTPKMLISDSFWGHWVVSAPNGG